MQEMPRCQQLPSAFSIQVLLRFMKFLERVKADTETIQFWLLCKTQYSIDSSQLLPLF